MFKGKARIIGIGEAPAGLPVAGGPPTEGAFTLNLQPIVDEGGFANATSFLLPVHDLGSFLPRQTVTLSISLDK